MQEFIITIVTDNGINPLFVKANTALIRKYNDQFNRADDWASTLSSLWVKEYGATLLIDKIVFANQNQMAVFLMKFS